MPPEAIATLISQAIRERVFAPGAPLIQEDLAKRFNVSRNPVREALRILTTEGLVTMTPGEGATVRPLSVRDLEEIYDLRIMLEPSIAPFIVQGTMRRDIRELTELATAMDEAESVAEWMRSNYEFHTRLYEIADRPHTEPVLRSLLNSVQPYSQENIGNLGGRGQASQEHHDMIAAIDDENSDELARLMRVHLETARDRLARAHRAAEDPLGPLRTE